MPRPQFTLRALLMLMFGAACFFGGIRFERERQRRANESRLAAKSLPRQKPNYGPPIVGSNTTEPPDKTMPTLKQWHND